MGCCQNQGEINTSEQNIKLKNQLKVDPAQMEGLSVDVVPNFTIKSGTDSVTEPSPSIRPKIDKFEAVSLNNEPQRLSLAQLRIVYGKELRILRLGENIIDNFEIAKQMNAKMQKVAHTSSQFRDIVQTIIQAVYELEKDQDIEERQIIDEIFENAAELNQGEHLFYHQVVKMYENRLKEKNKENSFESLSRIYHSIANFKKNKVVDEHYRNQFQIDCWKTNKYNKLSEEQMNEVVKLEAIGEKIERLGVRMRMKFGQIQKQSQNIICLLAKCLCRNRDEFFGLRYDLNEEEVKRMAQISRQACDYHDNGIVVLLIYFVKACERLQSKGIQISSIHRLIDNAIDLIFQWYPPGQGLQREHQHLSEALKNRQLKFDLGSKGSTFAHTPSRLTNDNPNKNKQVQLEDIIVEFANIAKNNRNDFEELVRETCFSLAIQTHIGLKLNPDNPKNKAIIRIKEKILFGKQQEMERHAKKTIQQTLKSEDQDYKKKIDELLFKKEEIVFKISDMVRGKCVFMDINDIIRTIDKIKAFVEKDKNKRFNIVEIQSRFTNPVPISDVTLKIVINKAIVAQLQLTIQSNAASYNFCHRVYELHRTKLFSKLKIVHNYYDEFGEDFRELTSKAIQLSVKEIATLTQEQKNRLAVAQKEAKEIPTHQKNKNKGKMSIRQMQYILSKYSQQIQNYMDLSQTKVVQFEDVIMAVLQDRMQHLPTIKICTNKYYQGIMIPLFNMEMGSWLKQLGEEINIVLNSKEKENSALLKATLMYFFFKKFNLPKQVMRMQEFFGSYNTIAKKQGFEWETIKTGKDYMKIYLNEMFCIDRPFDYANFTAKVYYETVQASSICMQKQKLTSPSKLVISQYVMGVVMEHNGIEAIQSLVEIILSYFNAIEESSHMTYFFKQYYKWILSLLNNNDKRFDSDLIRCKIQFYNVQLSLKDKKYSEAKSILHKLAEQFKKKGEDKKWLKCLLLLAECQAYNNSNQNQFTDPVKVFNQCYKIVEEKAKIVGLELRGKTVANSEWRIYLQLWKQNLSQQMKKSIQQVHLRKALTESCRSEGKQFVEKMVKAQKSGFNVFDLCTVMKNDNVRYIFFYNEEDALKRCQIMAKATKWPNLSTLNLKKNNIGDEGCALLSLSNWANLLTLNLDSNKIGDEGCQHLSSANWSNLQTLKIGNNKISAVGCSHLVSANWKYISTLNLKKNKISDAGIKNMQTAYWPYLRSLNLHNNSITDKGTDFLSQVVSMDLVSLKLTDNKIENGKLWIQKYKKKWPKVKVSL